MPKYKVKWSELSYYIMEVEAQNKDEAWDKAMNESNPSHIVQGDTQFEGCEEITESTRDTFDVIVDPLTGRREVSLYKENDNG